jgi:hypothetical protein
VRVVLTLQLSIGYYHSLIFPGGQLFISQAFSLFTMLLTHLSFSSVCFLTHESIGQHQAHKFGVDPSNLPTLALAYYKFADTTIAPFAETEPTEFELGVDPLN